MNSTECSVIGIDASKQRLDCCWGKTNSSFHMANTAQAIKAKLVALRQEREDIFLVVESTGKYHAVLFRVATELEIPIAIVNPKRIRDFAKALGQLAKTDCIDARIIARYALTVALEPTKAPSEELQNLRALVTRRTDLVRMVTQERNRLGDIDDPILTKSLRRHIKWLVGECKALEAQIKKAHQTLVMFLAMRIRSSCSAGLIESGIRGSDVTRFIAQMVGARSFPSVMLSTSLVVIKRSQSLISLTRIASCSRFTSP